MKLYLPIINVYLQKMTTATLKMIFRLLVWPECLHLSENLMLKEMQNRKIIRMQWQSSANVRKIKNCH